METSNTDDSRNCAKCTRSDSVNHMVRCDLCDAWLHYDCAGVSDSIADPNCSFKCDRCREEEAAEVASRISRVSGRSSMQSKGSQRLQLSLQLLEEQRALKLRQMKEEELARKRKEEEEQAMRRRRMEEEEKFLREKYHLLLAEADEANEGASGRSKLSSRASREKVQMWLSKEKCTDSQPVVSDSVATKVPSQTVDANVQPQANPSVSVQHQVPANNQRMYAKRSEVSFNPSVTTGDKRVVPMSTSTPCTDISPVADV